jgi:hypothetical protein
MKKITVKEIAYHRNGIDGEGFYVVLFSSKEDRKRNFIATVFEGRGQVSVIDVDIAAAGFVTFGTNSWRGDEFEAALRNEIKLWEIKRDAEITKSLTEI